MLILLLLQDMLIVLQVSKEPADPYRDSIYEGLSETGSFLKKQYQGVVIYQDTTLFDLHTIFIRNSNSNAYRKFKREKDFC